MRLYQSTRRAGCKLLVDVKIFFFFFFDFVLRTVLSLLKHKETMFQRSVFMALFKREFLSLIHLT